MVIKLPFCLVYLALFAMTLSHVHKSTLLRHMSKIDSKLYEVSRRADFSLVMRSYGVP